MTTEEIIKEIAEQLSVGFLAYIHKETEELVFVPDVDSYFDIDMTMWDEELEKLKKEESNYYEIEKWTSYEAFSVMEQFADQVKDRYLQSRLFDALSKKKPFSRFKYVIDNSGVYRQRWFDFRDNWQKEYVAKELEWMRSRPDDDDDDNSYG